MPSPNEAGSHLHQRNLQLHLDPQVERVVSHLRQLGCAGVNTPAAKLTAYLDFLSDWVNDGVLTGDSASIHRQVEAHVVADDAVPESYFDLQRRIAREQGYGDITITSDGRAELIANLQADQRGRLHSWLEYLTEGETYPHWFRYYAWESITNLGPYTAAVGGFPKRSRGTVSLFPDLNREALARVYTSLIQETPPTRSFSKLYAAAMQQCGSMTAEQRGRTNGVWVKYDRSSDVAHSNALAHFLQPWGTGWCTAGEATAHAQLKAGDFYVFHTADDAGNYVVPRIAIRMQDGSVAETRGVGAHQELEPSLVDTAVEKLQELPGGERYRRISADMKRVTLIDELTKKNPSCRLNLDDLRFLYEIDHKILGFGYQTDPRIAAIRFKRAVKPDLARIFQTTPDRISGSPEEALSGGIRFHYGDLYLGNLTTADGVTFPGHVGGNLHLSRLTSVDGLNLPSRVGGNLDLGALSSVGTLTLPDYVGGNLYLNDITSGYLTLPGRVGGNLDLGSFSSAGGLTLPGHVGGNLYLNALTSADGITLPDHVGGALNLSNLSNLSSADGLTFPGHIGGDLDLSGLTCADGITLPGRVGGDLYLGNLTSADGITLPDYVGGDLYLSSFASAVDFNLPDHFGGSIFLSGLTSAVGLNLPDRVEGDLYLGSLTTAEGLNFPGHVGGDLDLGRLTSAEGLALPDRVGGSLDLGRLASVDGLTLPDHVGGDLDLTGLTSAKGLNLPDHIGGHLLLKREVRLQMHQPQPGSRQFAVLD